MVRKREIYALALVTVVLSAVGASVASGNEFHSSSASGTTYLTAEQIGTNQLDTAGGTWKCGTVKGKGSYAGTTTSAATLSSITYSACTAFGLTAHVDMMGCDYRLTGENETTGTQSIECPTTGGGVTDEITVTPTQGGVGVCTLEIPEQEISLGIVSEAGSPEDIKTTPSASTITYRVTYNPADHTKTKCGTQGTHHDGIFTGSTTLTAFEDAEHASKVALHT